MLSAYEFYKLRKEKDLTKKEVEIRKLFEMLSEVAPSIKKDSLSNAFKPSLQQEKKAKSRESGSYQLNGSRKRPHSPSVNNAKRSKASESTVVRSSLTSVHCHDALPDVGEADSVPDLVPGSDIGDDVIDPLCLGERLFNFLIFPLSMDIFAKAYYGLKPFHSDGGNKRCNLNCFFPIQTLDNLISTQRLFFEKDVDLINASSNFSGRAYRSKIWSEFAASRHCVDGTSVRFLLPERYFIRFGVELGLLQDIFNGPVYSVVAFVTNSFEGPLIDTKSPSCPPGDVFIILLENYFTVTATPPPPPDEFALKVESNAEKSWNMKAGDVLYLPAPFCHGVKLEKNCQHAIALCIVNRTPVLIKEWGKRLIETMKIPQVPTHKSLFRQLLDSTNKSEARDGNLYIDLNAPSKIFSGVRKWLIGDNMTFDPKGVETVRGAIVELQKEFMRKTPLLWLHYSERDFHITTHGAYWEDHNYDIDLEDEDAIEMLQLQADRPHLEGNLCLEDLDLDLRSSVRITRRSAICVVEEPADPDNIHLYHTYLNSVDAREVNEIYGLKIPRNNITLCMINRLIENFPQSVIINELAKESEEAKTRLIDTLFGNGLIIATSIWDRREGIDDEEAKEEEADEDFDEYGGIGVGAEGNGDKGGEDDAEGEDEAYADQ